MQISKNNCVIASQKQFSESGAVVDPAGLEPATPALSRRCSNQLSYGSEVPSRGQVSRGYRQAPRLHFIGGGKETRTPDIKLAKLALYQLS